MLTFFQSPRIKTQHDIHCGTLYAHFMGLFTKHLADGKISSDIFIYSLQNRLLELLKKVGKSDLHCHSGRGGNINYLLTGKNNRKDFPLGYFSSLEHMQIFYHTNIKKYFSCKEGLCKRWEASFVRAKEENVKVLVLSFTPSKIFFLGGMQSFMKTVNRLHATYAPNIIFFPELTFERTCDVNLEFERLDEILEPNWFKSIDICSNESAKPIKAFKKIFRKAKENTLRLKAHVGEFGTADDVQSAVEYLELDEVHHGIAAASSKKVMNWLAKHKIQLNICPSSNVLLKRVDSYKRHPIRELYDAGIPVTINTDNTLIFNKSVSEEYLSLFECGLMTAKELDEIRMHGLRAAKVSNK